MYYFLLQKMLAKKKDTGKMKNKKSSFFRLKTTWYLKILVKSAFICYFLKLKTNKKLHFKTKNKKVTLKTKLNTSKNIIINIQNNMF